MDDDYTPRRLHNPAPKKPYDEICVSKACAAKEEKITTFLEFWQEAALKCEDLISYRFIHAAALDEAAALGVGSTG